MSGVISNNQALSELGLPGSIPNILAFEAEQTEAAGAGVYHDEKAMRSAHDMPSPKTLPSPKSLTLPKATAGKPVKKAAKKPAKK